MSAGFPVNKSIMDSRVGSITVALRDTLADAVKQKGTLDDMTDADIEALGYTAEDVNVLRSAFTDLAKLSDVAHAKATQAAANDFFFWANKLVGLQ